MMDEEQTRNSVMLEDLDRSVRLLAEAIAAQSERFDGMERTFNKRFDKLETEVAGIAIAIREVKTQVDPLEGKVDHLEVRFDKLDAKVDKLDAKVDKLDAKVDKLEGRVDKLEGRFDRLDGKVDKLDGKVDKLEAFATDAKPRLERIETHLALNAPLPRPTPKRPPPSKHHRRKLTKRT